jgi:hypothetical protein
MVAEELSYKSEVVIEIMIEIEVTTGEMEDISFAMRMTTM